MRPKRFLPPWLLTAGLAIPAVLPSTHAATLYWDGTSTGPNADGGAGTWNTTNTNWDTAATGGADSAWVNDSDVVFGGTGGSVVLGLTVKPPSITFQSSGYHLSGGTLDFQVPTVIATGPHNVTITSTLAGFLVVSVKKTGTGTLSLGAPGNSNFFFGSNFLVEEGVVKLGSASALGNAGSAAINTTVSAGATLDLNGYNPGSEGFGIAGAGVGGAGALVNNHASTAGGVGGLYLTAPATIGGISRWDIPSGKVLGMGGHTLTKVGGNKIRVAGAINTPGRIDIKAGSFWFDLASSTTFAGSSSNEVTVRSGTLLGMTSTGSSPWSASFEPNTTWRVMIGTGNTANPKWNGPVNFAGATTLDVRDNSSFTLGAAAVASGAGSVKKTGKGTWTVNSASDYSGGTTVDAGTLLLGGRNLQTGAGSLLGPVILNNGTTLRLLADQVLGTAPLQRVSPLNVNGALVESTATGANTLHVVKLSASTVRSTVGGNSPDAQGYFQMAAGGGIIMAFSSDKSSVIGGRLDLGAGPGTTTFDVENGLVVEDLRVDAAITGTPPGQGMIKTGDGLMLLRGPATFTGPTTVEEGNLLLDRNGSLPSSPVTVKQYGTFGTVYSGKSLAALTVEAQGSLILPAKTGSTTPVDGPLHFTNGNFVVSPVLGATATPGVIDLATAASPITGTGTPVVDFSAAFGPSRATGTVAVNGNKLQLTLTSAGGNLIWNNASAAGDAVGIWDTTLANFSLDGNDTAFQTYDSVTFDDSVAPGSIRIVTLGSVLAPALITVDNSNGEYRIGATENLRGNGSLLKSGTGRLTLYGTGAYPLAGDVTAAGGILSFNERSAVIDNLTLSGGAFEEATAAFNTAEFRSGRASAVLTGSGAWVKTTPGTVVLSGENLFAGPGTVAEGTLVVGNAALINYSSDERGTLGVGPVHIAPEGIVEFRRRSGGPIPNKFSGPGRLAMTGTNPSGEFTLGAWSTFILSADNAGFSGSIHLADAALVPAPASLGDAAVTLSGNSYLDLRNQASSNPVVFAHASPSVSTLLLRNSTQAGSVSLSASGTGRIAVTGGGILSGPIQDPGAPGNVSIEGDSPTTSASATSRLTLSGSSTHTGTTTVTNNGFLSLMGTLGATAVTVTGTGTIGGGGSIGAGGSLAFQQDGKLWVTPTGEALTVNGDVDLGPGMKVIVDRGVILPRGPFPILRYTGALTGGIPQMSLDPSSPSRQAVFDISPGLVTLDVGSKSLVWKGQSHSNWQLGTAANWNTDGNSETESFFQGDSVTFDDTGFSATINGSDSAVLLPSATLFDNTSNNYNVRVRIGGLGSITKRGTGGISLYYGAEHSGGTFVESGYIYSTSLGTGPVVVSAGATLAGHLSFTGPLTCAGTLNPGLITDTNTTTATVTLGPTVLSGTYQCLLANYGSDRVIVNGDLDLTGSTLSLFMPGSTGAPEESYTVLTYTGALTGTFANLTGMPLDFELVHDATSKSFVLKRLRFSEWVDSIVGLADPSPVADPDGDGFPNLVEYVLSGDPVSSDTSIMPTCELTSSYLIFRYKRRDSSMFDTIQAVQWSTDMITWKDITVGISGTSNTRNGDLPDDISVYISRPAGQKVFARLKVTPK